MAARQPVLIEFFAGTRSIGKAAEEKGFRVISLEKDPKFGCELTMDLFDFEHDSVPVPDFLWFSPPGTSFSTAAGGYHRNKDGTAKTEEALIGDRLVERCLDLIRIYKAKNPNLVWWMENPRGRLQNLGMKDFEEFKTTVTYCQYGDTRQKPTNIWTNCRYWYPKPMCKRGAPCHERAWRNSYGGTVGLWSAKDRSKIPEGLCQEIVSAMAREMQYGWDFRTRKAFQSQTGTAEHVDPEARTEEEGSPE